MMNGSFAAGLWLNSTCIIFGFWLAGWTGYRRWIGFFELDLACEFDSGPPLMDQGRRNWAPSVLAEEHTVERIEDT